MLHLPDPVERVGPRAALVAETHHVPRSLGTQGDLQADILQGQSGIRGERHRKLCVTIELQAAGHLHTKGPRRGGGLPDDHPRIVFDHAHPAGAPCHVAPVGAGRRELDRPGEELFRRFPDGGHLDREEAAEGGGHPILPDDHLATEDTECVATAGDGGVRRDDAVVLLETRVEPGQACEPPGLIGAGVANRVEPHTDGDRDGRRRKAGCRHGQRSTIVARLCVDRHLDAAPDGLDATKRDVDRRGELPPLPVNAALIEAAERRGWDGTRGSAQWSEGDPYVRQRAARSPDTQLESVELAARRWPPNAWRPDVIDPAVWQVGRHHDRTGPILRKHEKLTFRKTCEELGGLIRGRDHLHRVEGVEGVRRLEGDQLRLGQPTDRAGIEHREPAGGRRRVRNRVGDLRIGGCDGPRVPEIVDVVLAGPAGRLEHDVAGLAVDGSAQDVQHPLAGLRVDHPDVLLRRVGVGPAPGKVRPDGGSGLRHGHHRAMIPERVRHPCAGAIGVGLRRSWEAGDGRGEQGQGEGAQTELPVWLHRCPHPQMAARMDHRARNVPAIVSLANVS